ncbi:O-acetyltransferase OatA [Posidoniimonas polymericola]|uniref:O-acetyltransferase OatA n=1 Tax=Posidoniimonas polymericola TaxID=2528002 RepID=A0A5C5YUT4_9BACT|nr:acyltransferase family protein [Posidoniimonas polymericola]TWT78413.1 O-acetyltransferase OatA [Posidoniimonas polymericola]
MKYRPDIDGLRAVAVLPVIFFHLSASYCAGGFLGVDVFFVISGYLISSLVLEQQLSGSFTFKEFYSRRIRRILPALLAVVILNLAVAATVAYRPDRRSLGLQSAAAVASVANVYYWRNAGNYWGQAAEESPLLHTWSLSVEEQFYLVHPMLLLLLVRLCQRRSTILAFLAISMAASLGLFVWGQRTHPWATFYLLPPRSWELLAGACLAVFESLRTRGPAFRFAPQFAGTAGLVLLAMSMALSERIGAGTIAAVTGSCALIGAGTSALTSKLLAHPILVHIGRISYSLYLWHWPIIVYRNYFRVELSDVAVIALTYIVGLGSYHLVEQPVRRRSGAALPVLAIATLAFCLCIGVSKLPELYDTEEFAPPVWYGDFYDLRPHSPDSSQSPTMLGVTVPEKEHSPTAYRSTGIVSRSDLGNRPSVVVIGDSHGTMWSHTINEVTDSLGLAAAFWSMNGVKPYLGPPDALAKHLDADEKAAYDRAREEMLASAKPRLAIIACRWSKVDETQVMPLIELVTENCDRALLLEQPPELDIAEDRSVLQSLAYLNVTPQEGSRFFLPATNIDKLEEGRRLMDVLSLRFPSVHVVSLTDLYLQDLKAIVLDGREVVYLDDDHLTEYGAQLSKDRLRRAIVRSLE